jgi:hypothetical protein
MLMVVVYAAAGLRHRSAENKAVIVNQVEKIVWPAIVAGKVKPVVHMESNNHIGKILLLP